jgi:RNA polymerase sigma-70 factor (ECF subfamily)
MNPDEGADRLAQLFDAHADRLYRLARRLVPQQADALDLVQETFLRAAAAPRSIPPGARSEEAWLVRVLINLRRDEWRKQAVRKRHQHELPNAMAPVHLEDALVARALVWHALDQLPPRRRAIVVMHELEGLAHADIASLLGITVITVRWHLSRGRRELARRLRAVSGAHDEDANESPARHRSDPLRTAAK